MNQDTKKLEIEAARKAIGFKWQDGGGMVGAYLDCEGLAKAAIATIKGDM